MAAFGVPSFLLPAVIVLEIGGGLALLSGWRVRDAAGALAAFCVITAVVFHADFANKAERSLFFKDLAIAGGLLAMAAAAEAARRERSVPEGRRRLRECWRPLPLAGLYCGATLYP
jgi:putative oxidoreductase